MRLPLVAALWLLAAPAFAQTPAAPPAAAAPAVAQTMVEPPMLAEAVGKGTLPPVAQRLPQTPLVVDPAADGGPSRTRSRFPTDPRFHRTLVPGVGRPSFTGHFCRAAWDVSSR